MGHRLAVLTIIALIVTGCARSGAPAQDPKGAAPALSGLVPGEQVSLAPDVTATVWLPEQGAVTGGPLRLTDSSGRELLKVEAGVLEVIGTREVGAPFPTLMVMTAGGGSMGMYYEAYLWDPDQAALRRLNWEDATFTVSRSGVQQVDGGVKTTYREYLAQPDSQGRTWRERSAIWRYRDGVLHKSIDGM